MPNYVRPVEKLFNDTRIISREAQEVQASRLAGNPDPNLFKEHPGIEQSTIGLLTGRANKYLTSVTTGSKPSAGIALMDKATFESHFGKLDPLDADQADAQRKYFWQLKTGDGIEDLVVLKSRAGMVMEVQGKDAAAAMFRISPKGKIPVLIDQPGNDWATNPLRSLSYRGQQFPVELPRYAPPVRPTFKLDDNAKTGKIVFDPAHPANGDITTIDRGKTRQILLSFVPEEFKGQGRGIAMYEALANQTLAEGKTLSSDTKVSTEAARMYDALERRGFKVTRNEHETDEEGNLISTAGRPVFEVSKQKPKETSPTLSPQAE